MGLFRKLRNPKVSRAVADMWDDYEKSTRGQPLSRRAKEQEFEEIVRQELRYRDTGQANEIDRRGK